MRIVNSVFQGAGVTTTAPVAIDVLIDSSMSGAGLGGLAGPSLSPGAATGQGAGSHAGAAALFTAAGYRDLASGIHSFVARVSGTTSSFFQTSSGEYLPKQFMLPFPYTLYVHFGRRRHHYTSRRGGSAVDDDPGRSLRAACRFRSRAGD